MGEIYYQNLKNILYMVVARDIVLCYRSVVLSFRCLTAGLKVDPCHMHIFIILLKMSSCLRRIFLAILWLKGWIKPVVGQFLALKCIWFMIRVPYIIAGLLFYILFLISFSISRSFCERDLILSL